MIAVDIPGFRKLALEHLVLDYNGTLAFSGALLGGVAEALLVLAHDLEIHVITADTFGVATAALAGLPVSLTITPPEDQAELKLEYVTALQSQSVIAIGNGRNDRYMLQKAAVGIAVLPREGAASEAILAADLVCPSILDAFGLLTDTRRLIATLRS
jgi:P-type E1-E2 ATPase